MTKRYSLPVDRQRLESFESEMIDLESRVLIVLRDIRKYGNPAFRCEVEPALERVIEWTTDKRKHVAKAMGGNTQ